MNGQEAIEWIHQQLKFGIRPGLDRVKRLLEQVGNPEQHVKLVHVAGTNGKGSTVTYLRNLLNTHGFRVGTFTSPYIERFEERISLDGEPIDSERLASYIGVLKPICEDISQTSLGPPTEFEIITVLSLMYFNDEEVDFALIEVGLGGRLDSTNVIHPILSLITSIGMDHTDILGDTYEEIAFEKAGIIKTEIPIASNVQGKEAAPVIGKKAEEMKAPYFRLGIDYSYELIPSKGWGERFHVTMDGNRFEHLEIQMKGRHQVKNATLALFALYLLSKKEGFLLDKAEIKQGLLQSKWPGRLEVVYKEPQIVVDGAHNAEAIKELITSVNEQWEPKQVTVLMSVLKGKPFEEMLAFMLENFQKITLTPFDFSHSYRYNELCDKFKNQSINIQKNWKKTIDTFLEQNQPDEVLLITGSLYFVSQVRTYILHQK